MKPGHGPDRPEAPARPRRVVAVVSDLFFATRILETGRALGIAVERPVAGDVLTTCRAQPPDLVLLDLHAPGDPVGLGRALKSDPLTSGVPIVAFYAHVESALRAQALAAGIDRVLPRSAFTARLPALLRGEPRSAT